MSLKVLVILSLIAAVSCSPTFVPIFPVGGGGHTPTGHTGLSGGVHGGFGGVVRDVLGAIRGVFNRSKDAVNTVANIVIGSISSVFTVIVNLTLVLEATLNNLVVGLGSLFIRLVACIIKIAVCLLGLPGDKAVCAAGWNAKFGIKGELAVGANIDACIKLFNVGNAQVELNAYINKYTGGKGLASATGSASIVLNQVNTLCGYVTNYKQISKTTVTQTFIILTTVSASISNSQKPNSGDQFIDTLIPDCAKHFKTSGYPDISIRVPTIKKTCSGANNDNINWNGNGSTDDSTGTGGNTGGNNGGNTGGNNGGNTGGNNGGNTGGNNGGNTGGNNGGNTGGKTGVSVGVGLNLGGILNGIFRIITGVTKTASGALQGVLNTVISSVDSVFDIVANLILVLEVTVNNLVYGLGSLLVRLVACIIKIAVCLLGLPGDRGVCAPGWNSKFGVSGEVAANADISAYITFFKLTSAQADLDAYIKVYTGGKGLSSATGSAAIVLNQMNNLCGYIKNYKQISKDTISQTFVIITTITASISNSRQSNSGNQIIDKLVPACGKHLTGHGYPDITIKVKAIKQTCSGANNDNINWNGGGNTGGHKDGNTGGDKDGNTGGNKDGNTGGNKDGNTGGNKDGNTGGNKDGNTGGNTGGDKDGNTGGNKDGNTGGNKDGNTGGNKDGNTGGNKDGNTGGNKDGNTGGDKDGNTGGNKDGNTGGNKDGNTGGNTGGDKDGNTGGNKDGNTGGDKDGNTGGNKDGNTGGDKDGNTGGNKDGNTGGNKDGNTGGNTGGNKDGNTGGNKDGNTGGNKDGNTGGDKDGNTGGNKDGNTGGNKDGNTGGNKDGNTGGNKDGKTGGNKDGNTGGDKDGNTGGNKDGNTGGNNDGNTGGNKDGNTGGNKDGNTGGNKDGNTGGDKDGNTGGNKDGNTGGNKDGNTGGNKDGNTGGNKDGNTGGNKDGNTGGDKDGNTGGNKDGNTGGNKDGNTGGDKDGNTGGDKDGNTGGNKDGNTGGNKDGNTGGDKDGNTGGNKDGNTGGNKDGNTGGDKDGNTGGNKDGNTGGNNDGNTGGNKDGNTGGNKDGNTGGNKDGNTGGDKDGNTGGNKDGNTGGDKDGNTGGNKDGNTGGNKDGNTGGNKDGNTGGNKDGNTGGDNGGSSGGNTVSGENCGKVIGGALQGIPGVDQSIITTLVQLKISTFVGVTNVIVKLTIALGQVIDAIVSGLGSILVRIVAVIFKIGYCVHGWGSDKSICTSDWNAQFGVAGDASTAADLVALYRLNNCKTDVQALIAAYTKTNGSATGLARVIINLVTDLSDIVSSITTITKTTFVTVSVKVFSIFGSISDSYNSGSGTTIVKQVVPICSQIFERSGFASLSDQLSTIVANINLAVKVKFDWSIVTKTVNTLAKKVKEVFNDVKSTTRSTPSLTAVLNLQAATSFDDVCSFGVNVVQALSGVLDAFISGLGSLIARIVGALINHIVAVLGAARNSKSFVAQKSFYTSFGVTVSGNTWAAISSGFKVTSCKADLDGILNTYTKNKGLKSLSGARLVIFNAAYSLAGIVAKGTAIVEADLTTVFEQVTIILGAFANSLSPGVGKTICDNLLPTTSYYLEQNGYPSVSASASSNIYSTIATCNNVAVPWSGTASTSTSTD